MLKPKLRLKPKLKPKPIPPKPKPVPVKPKPVPVKPKPVPKPVPTKKKPQPKPAPKPAVSKAQEDTLALRLKKMKAAQEKKASEQARKDRIAALKADALAESSKVRSPIADAPVGMADGTGDEAGVSAFAFVREFIQQQWSFSKYQAAGNPEAEMQLFYNAAGTLLHYKFVKKSGNSAFDESLTRAIVKSRQLNQPLPECAHRPNR